MPDDRFDHVFIQPKSFDASVAFYRDVLGWDEKAAWGGDGSPRGAVLGSHRMTVVLAEHHDAGDHSKSHGINGTRPTVHLAVSDIDKRFADLERTGTTRFAPEANHWGTRWFVVEDPDGNLIAFEEDDQNR